uniref:NADH dehydrogenase subunit 2 n=1 Tax=Artyfechinostomum sufrartyfex TaxID=408854 RepID=A0A1P8P0K1_9TREM|nr:NADH dehydrogenase subunit 2 [Artyfechinostomum sufrartyfex]APX55331.1 NADH dehydrogenase subunit 2 [Artyfechinostomum sufrartyfex]ARH10830.1 NADH dehydrogenase subunit 2 [Artyfechinostomum sufrartyfex]
MWIRGVAIAVLGVLGVLSFSILIFSANGLSFFWLFLELATLCVIPTFFLGTGDSVLSGLFSYIVVSSVSSSLILCGMISGELLFLLVVGLILKFGLFPLWGWVYKVVLNSNWLVVWSLSTFLKSPVLFFPFFLSCGGCSFVNYVCCFTFIGLAVLFWLYSLNWYTCWCHMMLSSSAALVAMSLVLSSEVLFFIFFIYCLWCSCVVLFFCLYDDASVGGLGYYFWFCFLLVSIPVSVSLFYKLLMVVGMYSCWFFVLACWVVYSISEQFYLLKFVMSFSLPKSGGSFVSVV